MPRHIIEEDLVLTLGDYVKKSENTPSRIVVTNATGDIVVKSDLNVSQLDHLKNVTSDIQLQINNKSDLAHEHEEYLTLEELKDINFSGVAQDVVYDPTNANLESTNVKDALDEVDNKVEEYITKQIEDKAELKTDIANVNSDISDINRSIESVNNSLEDKADINHTHSGVDHTHANLEAGIQANTSAINETNSEVSSIRQITNTLPSDYASKGHTHQDLLDQMESINTDITAHRHTDLEEAITTVNTKVNTNVSDITSINSDIRTVKEDITDLTQSKADIGHTHEASDHVHQDILDSLLATNNSINEKIADEVDRADGAYAEKTHEHTEYATTDHTHSGSEHNHDGVYAPNFHIHDNYADIEHYHNEEYAPLDHNHTGVFSPVDHTHSDLANKEHTHHEFSNFVSGAEKDQPNGIAGLDANAKISLALLPDTAKAINIVGTNADRLALTDIENGTIFRETDTGDSYIYDGVEWHILADADWANVSLDWSNITGVPTEFNPMAHNHEEYALVEHTHEDLGVATKPETIVLINNLIDIIGGM